MIQTENYDLPAHWASALINGDESGLEPEDSEALEAFTADMVAEYGQCWAIDCSEEPSFTAYHDAKRYGVLACETLTFTFDTTRKA